MIPGVAPRYTHVAASTTDGQIESEETVIVHAIVAQFTSAGIIRVEERDGSTVIMLIEGAANTTFSYEQPFLAPRGVNITTPSGTTCTVFHSAGGA